MKKLSVLIALALVLTIGGAYASWTYVAGLATAAEGTPFGISMTVTEDTTLSVGKLSTTFTPDFTVEPTDDSTDDGDGIDYTPVLDPNNTTDLVITFTPDDTASADVKNNAVAITVTITISTAFGKYNSNDVITLADDPTFVINSGTGEGKWTKNDDGTFTCTITVEQIMSKINLYDDVQLLTAADATTYKTALEAGKIKINVNGNVVTQ